LIVCDEALTPESPLATLKSIPKGPLAILIGPEGGFADDERASLSQHKRVIRLSLGPRILRADTAAVAAFALVQVTLGDWQ
jgi:16S rRNA (uracil1498-N3)-methyltransferase